MNGAARSGFFNAKYMEHYKETLLNNLKQHIDIVRAKVREKLAMVKVQASKSIKELSKMSAEDQALYNNLKEAAEKRVVELAHLDGSPYFMKCQVTNELGEGKNYFFAKHEFSDESIYSWVAPVAAIRFENPGPVSYRLPNGKMRNVNIEQKEQFTIVNGKPIFFTLQTKDKAPELIYQEHFTTQKSGFVLPEIVAQMEKAQDQVIRAHYKGPLVISGPAGSGKTTLALHRVAYLTQAPDTSELYPPRSIIVFVQDTGTKEYFSTLLPELGITNVTITTFSEWALMLLGLTGFIYGDQQGETEEEKNIFEYQKLRAIRETQTSNWNQDPHKVLNSQYRGYFNEASLELYESQMTEKRLDRFDLSILLQAYFKKHQSFETKREYNRYIKDKLVHKVEKTKVQYSLMVIDEFQNYLPEQINIFKKCLHESTGSVVYVGDMAQQVKLGTIKNWMEVEEDISVERNIQLSKVYRNTKNILSFIKSLGYQIEVPEKLKEGPEVIEMEVNTPEAEIEYIKNIVSKYKDGSIGILGKDAYYLNVFKNEFKRESNIHILTMLESQGVEFDLVIIVGINTQSFEVTVHDDMIGAHIEERKQIQKDLLYVALTRAITELHVLGSGKLSQI